MLRKVYALLRLGLLEFGHQMVIADIDDGVILSTGNMNGYGFVLVLREDVLRAGQEKINVWTTEMVRDNQSFDEPIDGG